MSISISILFRVQQIGHRFGVYRKVVLCCYLALKPKLGSEFYVSRKCLFSHSKKSNAILCCISRRIALQGFGISHFNSLGKPVLRYTGLQRHDAVKTVSRWEAPELSPHIHVGHWIFNASLTFASECCQSDELAPCKFNAFGCRSFGPIFTVVLQLLEYVPCTPRHILYTDGVSDCIEDDKNDYYTVDTATFIFTAVHYWSPFETDFCNRIQDIWLSQCCSTSSRLQNSSFCFEKSLSYFLSLIEVHWAPSIL